MTETDVHPLQLTAADVASLTRPQREMRVENLIKRAFELYDEALSVHLGGLELASTVVLFSGGIDSTTLAHLFRDRATHAGHANTTIGAEFTRQFVRDTCASWGLPLLERQPPVSYDDLVMEQGFPGPAQHFKMYQRLKERALRQIRRELVVNGRRQRVVFLAGRRRDESKRRGDVPLHERVDSVIWSSPMAEWTKLDLNTYRLMCGDVPVNELADLLHMSCECLCGAFAKPGELQLLNELGAEWLRPSVEQVRSLEAWWSAQPPPPRNPVPLERRKWGWGAYRDELRRNAHHGLLCQSCAS